MIPVANRSSGGSGGPAGAAPTSGRGSLSEGLPPRARVAPARSRGGAGSAGNAGRAPIRARASPRAGRARARHLRPGHCASASARSKSERRRLGNASPRRRRAPSSRARPSRRCTRGSRCRASPAPRRRGSRPRPSPAPRKDDQVEKMASHARRSLHVVADLAQRGDRVLLHSTVISCRLNFACSNSAVSRSTASAARREPEKHPAQVLDRGLARPAREAVAVETRLHARVRGDHGACADRVHASRSSIASSKAAANSSATVGSRSRHGGAPLVRRCSRPPHRRPRSPRGRSRARSTRNAAAPRARRRPSRVAVGSFAM